MESVDLKNEELIKDEIDRPLNRWILRLSYMVQTYNRKALSYVLLFTQEKENMNSVQWKHLLTYLLQTIYQRTIMQDALFNSKTHVDLFNENADHNVIKKAKDAAYQEFLAMSEDVLNEYGIKQNYETFDKLISDVEANRNGMDLPVISEEAQAFAYQEANEWFDNAYEEHIDLMKKNKVMKSDFDTLLHMALLNYEFKTTDELSLVTW